MNYKGLHSCGLHVEGQICLAVSGLAEVEENPHINGPMQLKPVLFRVKKTVIQYKNRIFFFFFETESCIYLGWSAVE